MQDSLTMIRGKNNNQNDIGSIGTPKNISSPIIDQLKEQQAQQTGISQAACSSSPFVIDKSKGALTSDEMVFRLKP